MSATPNPLSGLLGGLAEQETSGQTACAHELWYYAPGIGLVEINAVWEHTIIKRIN